MFSFFFDVAAVVTALGIYDLLSIAFVLGAKRLLAMQGLRLYDDGAIRAD